MAEEVKRGLTRKLTATEAKKRATELLRPQRSVAQRRVVTIAREYMGKKGILTERDMDRAKKQYYGTRTPFQRIASSRIGRMIK